MLDVASVTDEEIADYLSRVTVDEIDTELASRSLYEFVKQAWRWYVPSPFVDSWHIGCVCEHLKAVTDGQILDLIVNVPPRTGKSSVVSVAWPVWSWLQKPNTRWLCASYAESLSVRDALASRRLIQTRWFRERWGDLAPKPRFTLTGDQNTKGRYDNNAGGYRIASSVGGSNTGEGGDIIAVDDPHNVTEADSDLKRNAVLTWMDETMATRRNDLQTSARVVIMQRVHGQDLTGHLLETGNWHHLCLPMRWEPATLIRGVDLRDLTQPQPHDDCAISSDPRTQPGELLWPERFPEAALLKLGVDLGAIGEASQQQQRPVPREGAVFISDWFRPLPEAIDRAQPAPDTRTLRQTLRRAQYWDLAYSEKAMSDYTAAVTLGEDSAGNHYILNAYRERIGEQDQVAKMADHIAITRPDLVGVEIAAYRQQATLDLVRLLSRELAKRGVASYVTPVAVDKDKVTRALIPAGRAKLGMVYADRGAPWWGPFERELLAFPRDAHDDQCFVAGTMIATTRGDRPIESIRVGDSVLTPLGPCRVRAAGLTGDAEVMTLGPLTGTPGHKLLDMRDGAWKRMDALTGAARLDTLSLGGLLKWTHRSTSLSTASLTGSQGRAAITSLSRQATKGDGARRGCTLPFGSTTAGRPSRRVTSFTTKTAIHSITTTAIWSAYRAANTLNSINRTIQKSKLRTWSRFAVSLLSGTLPPRGLSGIAGTLKQGGRIASSPLSLASVVGSKSKLTGRPRPSTAQSSAMSEAALLARTSREVKPVYNLSVENAGCYYAAGILVSNCDAYAGATALLITTPRQPDPPKATDKHDVYSLTGGQARPTETWDPFKASLNALNIIRREEGY